MSFATTLIEYTLRNRVSRSWALSALEWLAERHRLRCGHSDVTADKLEGDVRGQAVSTCRQCGCVRRNGGEWQLP